MVLRDVVDGHRAKPLRGHRAGICMHNRYLKPEHQREARPQRGIELTRVDMVEQVVPDPVGLDHAIVKDVRDTGGRCDRPQVRERAKELRQHRRQPGVGFAGDVSEGYRRHFPQDRAMTDLGQWHAFETQNPETFANMYQFWVQKPAA